jgi:ubiquinone/menaquinone biosynthesis C-methylase UbiE
MMTDTTISSEQPKSATRGNPSFVWRAGQERRLAMLNAAVPLSGKTVLVDGCGLGAYVRGIRRFTERVYGLDIEVDRVIEAERNGTVNLMAAVCEHLPFSDEMFDVVYSHEVLEHVQDDRQACREMARVLTPGGRVVLFVPNRLYPFETHGVYFRGHYHFGNKPFVNWLPDYWRNKLAPHVRAYTSKQLIGLFEGTPMHAERITQVYPGFDNIVARFGAAGRVLRAVMQGMEESPMRAFGLSHFLVMRKIVTTT